MFAIRKIGYLFSSIPPLPYDITTIYKPKQLFKYPSIKCMMPAATLTFLSIVTQWNPAYYPWTLGLLSAGWIYYIFNVCRFSLSLIQLSANKDFSQIFIHHNGGFWAKNYYLKELHSDVQYNEITDVLSIPTNRIQVIVWKHQQKINFHNIFLIIYPYKNGTKSIVGPIDLQTNQITTYNDHFKLFCYQKTQNQQQQQHQ